MVDDTQLYAVGKKPISFAIQLFTEHVGKVAGIAVSSNKREIITNDERIRTDVRNNKVVVDALRKCTRNLGCRLRLRW